MQKHIFRLYWQKYVLVNVVDVVYNANISDM